MNSQLVELAQSKDLIISWTWREIRIRYSQSIVGSAWAILQPLSLMIIFTLIFSLFLKVPTTGIPYPVFAYTALLPWTFFSNALSTAIPSLVNNMGLVSKIYFPREILPVSSVIANFIDFLIATSIYVVLLIIYHISLSWTIVFVPLIILVQLILTIGITLAASAVNVFYRDVRFVIPLALQLLMYASPIIYDVSSVPANLKPFYFLNPMAVIIDTYRRVILQNQLPDWPYFGLATLISVLILVLSYRYFKKAEREFADLI